MAKKSTLTTKQIDTLTGDYSSDYEAIKPIHDEFEEKENMILGTPKDSISQNETVSTVQDPTLLSAVIKQNNSVMAQMPTGKVTALSLKNRGKSLFMDLILHEHVLPHAKTQYDPYVKLWLLSFYRKVYGSFGVMVDYNVGKKYVGPDFTLIPARSIIPQAGRTTIEGSDHVFVRSKVTRGWLESRNKDIWKNIDKVLEVPHGLDDSAQKTANEQNYQRTGNKNEFELITKYEGDRWATFSKDAQVVLRDFGNPQKNDEIPVVMCHAYPLMDRFFGLGEFERGKTLHYALSSLINLYLDGVKMSIFPPLKVDPTSVADWNSFNLGPGSVWLMNAGQLNGIEQMQFSPQGLNTFQSTYSFLKGAVLTLTNTTDTSVSEGTDPGFGKTPQALKMQAMTEGMKTQFDRRMLEIATEDIFDKMIDLIAKRQEEPIELYLHEEDLKKVEEVAPDVVEMFETGNMGRVVVKPQDIANCEYRYEIDAGSTVKKDEIIENQTLSELISLISKIPGSMEQVMQMGGFKIGNSFVDFGELMKRWVISSGIQDWDKIIQEQDPNQANFEQQGLNQAFQQMQPLQTPEAQAILNELMGGIQQGMPQQGMPQQGMPPMGGM